jgi:glycosyltransferase involved in cell wall biosynthesis
MKSNRSGRPVLSVVVGLHNQAGEALAYAASLKAALARTGKAHEIVFVDDGSTDETTLRLAGAARRDPRVRLVRLRTEFGEASALHAGIQASRGRIIAYFSGRVRVNPDGLPALVNRLDAGADFVVGRRHPRRDSRLNQAVSRGFNRLVSRATRLRLRDVNSGVFVTRRDVLDRIPFYGDLVNFIPVLAAQQGYAVAEEDIEQLPGTFRQSRYPREYIQRLLDVLTVFFLTRYSRKPIHFMGFVGTGFAAAGLVIELYLFVYRILGFGAIAGRPLLVLGALLLVIGVQMISIGLLGEMIIFTHAGDMEPYNVEETIN